MDSNTARKDASRFAARRPAARSHPPARWPLNDNYRQHPPLTGDTAFDRGPRIPAGPELVEDLHRIRASGATVVLTDGQAELAAVVPVERYRALLQELNALRALHATRDASTAPPHRAVLDQAELDALLTDWDHSRPPQPASPITRSIRPVSRKGRRGRS